MAELGRYSVWRSARLEAASAQQLASAFLYISGTFHNLVRRFDGAGPGDHHQIIAADAAKARSLAAADPAGAGAGKQEFSLDLEFPQPFTARSLALTPGSSGWSANHSIAWNIRQPGLRRFFTAMVRKLSPRRAEIFKYRLDFLQHLGALLRIGLEDSPFHIVVQPVQ